MPESSVSVVIASKAAPESLDACLASLQPQLDGDVEVLVEAAAPVPSAVRDRYPWARVTERPGALVPELWRDGIDASGGDVVALTIAQMRPSPDWIDQIRLLHERFDAVGGAIEPGAGLRLVDWAEYFCRYSRDMRPLQGHETLDLPGDNAAYKRAVLEPVRDSYRGGFWEPFVHRRLAKNGVVHWQDPALVVSMARSTGFAAFTAQRLSHGRQYGRDRGRGFSTARRVVGISASPVVPFLMTSRVFRLVLRKRRYRGRAIAALPLIFWFNSVWAFAEARGYADLLRQ